MTRATFSARTRRTSTTWMMLLCASVLAASLLAGCGKEDAIESTPLGERASNDIPMDPPTLEFRVSPTGTVDASPEREAEAGEAVTLLLDNDSDDDYELRLIDPEGGQVFSLTAPATEQRHGRALPREPGSHVVEVFPSDGSGTTTTFTVDVSRT